MLTPEKLNTLVTLKPQDITVLLKQNKYPHQDFASVRFLGITNGWQICYSVTTNDKEQNVGKVFITYNHVNSGTVADYQKNG
jgi:hypothetical protein